MTAKHRKILLSFGVLLVLLAGVALWIVRSDVIAQRIQAVLTEQINNSINGHLRFERLNLVGFGSASLQQVDLEDAYHSPVLHAKEIKVEFSLWDLLTGHVGVSSLQKITLLQPEMHVRREANGVWNVETLRKQTGETEDAFQGRIAIEQGQIYLAEGEKQLHLEDINGTADVGRHNSLDYQLNALYQQQPFSLRGHFTDKNNLQVRVTAEAFQPGELLTQLPLPKEIILRQVNLQDLDCQVELEEGRVAYHGDAVLLQGAADLYGYQIEQGKGRITFNQNQVNVYQGFALINKQPLHISGQVMHTGDKPVLDIFASSPEMELSALQPEIPVRGAVSFALACKGKLENPTVNGHIELGQGSIANVDVQALTADIYLHQHQLSVTKASAAALSGMVEAEGTVQLDSQKYHAQIHLRQIALEQIPQTAVSLRGRADADLSLNGQGQSLPLIAGTVRARSLLINGVEMEELSAGLSADDQATYLDYADAKIGQGHLFANGRLASQDLQLSVSGQGIPLERFSAAASMPLEGTGAFNATVSGTIEQPKAQIHFNAGQGQIRGIPFEQIQGQAILEGQVLHLAPVQVFQQGGTHELQGTVGLYGEHPLQLSISSRRVRAESIMAHMVPQVGLTGNMDNTMQISGTLSAPQIQGQIHLWDGSIQGRLLREVRGNYRLDGSDLYLENVEVEPLEGQMLLGGRVSLAPEGTLDIHFQAKGLQLAHWIFNDAYHPSGLVDLQGHIGGNREQPALDLQIGSPAVTVNGYEFTRVDGKVQTFGSRIHIPLFHFYQGEGYYTFTGGYDRNNETMYGNFQVQGGDVGQLLKMAQSPVTGVEGKLNGTIEIGGTKKQPNLAIEGNIQQGKIKEYSLEGVSLKASLRNRILTIDKLEGHQGKGMLAVQGTLALDGEINMQVGGTDINAALVPALFDSKVPLTGDLTFSAQIGGTTQNPNAALSLQVADGTFGTASFDEMFGLFHLQDGIIQVNQALLSKGPYRASAYGTIPTAALRSEEVGNQAQTMDLVLTLDRANLSILPLLTKQVDWAAGDTKGQVKISGTLQHPQVNGSLLVPVGTVKLHGVAKPITNFKLDLQFQGNQVLLNTCRGQMGAGNFEMKGQAEWMGQELTDYRLDINLNQLEIEHEYFRGPLQGELHISHTPQRPVLSGTLNFERVTVNIPLIPAMGEGELPDIGLDVDLVAGQKVRLYNKYLYDMYVEGKAHFGGTTLQPACSGSLGVTRGTVTYLHNSFKIKEARADFTQFRSFIPVIHLEADTRVGRNAVHLSLEGPLQAMDLRLTSDPPMSQEEILSLLTLRDGGGKEDVMGILNAGLQMQVLGTLESAFRETLHLDEFHLVRGNLTDLRNSRRPEYDTEVYNVEFGKYLNDRLYLSYIMGLDYDLKRLSVRYDLNSHVSLNASKDNYDEQRLGIEMRYRF